MTHQLSQDSFNKYKMPTVRRLVEVELSKLRHHIWDIVGGLSRSSNRANLAINGLVEALIESLVGAFRLSTRSANVIVGVHASGSLSASVAFLRGIET